MAQKAPSLSRASRCRSLAAPAYVSHDNMMLFAASRCAASARRYGAYARPCHRMREARRAEGDGAAISTACCRHDDGFALRSR